MFPKRLEEFRDYIYTFYGPHGIYELGCTTRDIEEAIFEYVSMVLDPTCHMSWGEGDSIDRERVRTILEERGFHEKII
jgi:hypothetical protein